MLMSGVELVRRGGVSSAIEDCRWIPIEMPVGGSPIRRALVVVLEPGLDCCDARVVEHDVIGDVP